MPKTRIGQMITFAVELDSAQTYTSYIWITAKKGDTVRKIVARRGHPEMAATVAQLNGIRNPAAPLPQGRRLRLPGVLAPGNSISVLADDPRPTIKDGYAQYATVPRPGREGISRFTGYNPIAYDISIQFEDFMGGDGSQIEADIRELEKMAGRGQFPGASVGPPSIIRISVTDNNGRVIMLMPANYQWSASNPSAPLWRVSNITWDPAAVSDGLGQRIRQKAVVEVTKYTPVQTSTRSATERSRQRNTPSSANLQTQSAATAQGGTYDPGANFVTQGGFTG